MLSVHGERKILNHQKQAKLIKAGIFIDGKSFEPKENIHILIQNDKIQRISIAKKTVIPKNIEVSDLSDKTVMPGLIDAHMHFFGVPSLDVKEKFTETKESRILRALCEAGKMLKAGITSACCQGSSISPVLRKLIDVGYIKGPRIICAGEFICSTGGTWDYFDIPIDIVNKSGIFADGVDELRKKVRERIRQGANIIKIGLSKGHIYDSNHIWGDNPCMTVAAYSAEEVRAVVEEAHLNGLKVSAHCIGDISVQLALNNGIDLINHGYGINEETRNKILKTKKMIVSTISQIYFHIKAEKKYNYSLKRKEIYRIHWETMKRDFKKNIEKGIKYALGSDLVGYPTHPQDQFAKEFELAVKWGMKPMQAIISGTKNSAEAIGIDKITGTIEPNKAADIIAFKGNPLDDIKVLQNIDFVMKNGQVLYS